MPKYPDDDRRIVRAGRFLNLLDDAENKLSPVKFNTWAANLTAISAALGTAVAWIGGHTAGVEMIWGGVAGWLTQAHVTHHMDKRERNRHV